MSATPKVFQATEDAWITHASATCTRGLGFRIRTAGKKQYSVFTDQFGKRSSSDLPSGKPRPTFSRQRSSGRDVNHATTRTDSTTQTSLPLCAQEGEYSRHPAIIHETMIRDSRLKHIPEEARSALPLRPLRRFDVVPPRTRSRLSSLSGSGFTSSRLRAGRSIFPPV